MYVCSVKEIPKSVGVADPLITIRGAKHLIRRMPGGSQSILVRCDDEELYVFKFNNNPQGPNLLVNEMLRSEFRYAVERGYGPWRVSRVVEFKSLGM